MVLGIQTWSFSSGTYPAVITNEGDTLCAITYSQLVKVNQAINKSQYLTSENQLLKKDIIMADSLIVSWKNVSLKQDSIIFLQQHMFEACDTYSKSLEDAIKAEKKKNLKTTFGVGAGGVLIGILVTLIFK